MKVAKDQGQLFGYMSPDGAPALHPPLCACGACPCPVEQFGKLFYPDQDKTQEASHA